MKKGLLSILASALLVVGCQNYDDQFTLLENQITALTQTVSGLSQVQSTLATLSGTVTSLSSTVTGLGDAIDTAVAEGLADIQEDITAIEAAVAAVASADAVKDLADAVAASQDDLDELLANSSVFTGDVNVNSVATLDAFLAMGTSLNIVNGNVNITVSTDMDQTKVQTLVDNMLTIVKDLTYTSNSADIAETTFDNLSGVQSITITQGGGMRFPNLVSAAIIRLNDNFESGTNPVDVIHFGSLTSVTSFQTDTDADTIEFMKATQLHLTSLPRYGAALTLKVDEGGTVLIPVLASVDADGDESTLDLTVEGASSLDFSLITDGDISAKDVASVTGGADHDGDITLEGVTKAVIPNFTRSLTISDSNDLDYLHVIGAIPNVATGQTAVTVTPGLDLTGQTNLETVIIDGTLGAVTLSGNTNLTNVTYTASSESLEVTGASDLVNLSLAGKTKSISITSNTDLETLAITTELNTAKGNVSAASTAGSLTIESNADLLSVASAFDPVNSVSIKTNTKLATIDFTGTALVGATTDKASVDISGNALNASKVVDTYAAADTAASDLTGSISDESKISTLKTYLTAAIVVPSDTGVKLSLDTVDLWQVYPSTGAPTEYTDINSAHAQAALLSIVDIAPKILNTDGVTAAAGNLVLSYQTGDVIDIDHVLGGVTTNIVSTTLLANPELAAAELLKTANGYVATAAAVDVVLSAKVGGASSLDITILADNSSATNEATNANAGVASTTWPYSDDYVGLTIDGLTVTNTFGAGATTTAAIAKRLADIWNLGKTATNTAFTADGDTVSGTITVSAPEAAGSRFDGKAVSVYISTGTSTATTPVIGYKIGAFRAASDNVTVSKNVLVTLTSLVASTDAHAIQAGAVTSSGNDVGLTLVGGTATTTDVQPTLALSDVVTAADTLDATVKQAATTINYLSWVGV